MRESDIGQREKKGDEEIQVVDRKISWSSFKCTLTTFAIYSILFFVS